jgi:hypothetical protein
VLNAEPGIVGTGSVAIYLFLILDDSDEK